MKFKDNGRVGILINPFSIRIPWVSLGVCMNHTDRCITPHIGLFYGSFIFCFKNIFFYLAILHTQGWCTLGLCIISRYIGCIDSLAIR